ncbi:hypothetical protein LTR62_008248 [Meristemomyces frigidus]|uniref:Phosphoribosylaminoimidazole carboxylase n=1 Tax=Meristemomyces frigidus TaxID=1508187 RepID=A0AAN7YCY9_9PEZI|nr:hypothetical protein LTR62_008248 [Meristemomyces frigidus]
MEKRVGVLGGGQLGAMLAEAANLLRIPVNILDVGHSSAKQITHLGTHIEGSFKDPEAIKKLAACSDVVTVEIEHVDTHILEEIAAAGADVQPHWKTLRTIQDKYEQKLCLINDDVATARSVSLKNAAVADLEGAAGSLGLPLMLKSRREAYDGRGNFAVQSKDDFRPALEALGGDRELYAEKWANFTMELAVMVVKTKDTVLSFPTTETVHENSICKLTYTPARGVSKTIDQQAQALARKAVACFAGKGVFGVEMFLVEGDKLLVNEIAPRPHNSGHYTIEACPVSQYEAHLSAILDLPLHQESLRLNQPAIMLNILGGETEDSHMKVVEEAMKLAVRPKIHLYGKGKARKGRKMGHLTVTAATMREAEEIMQPLIDFVDTQNGKKVFGKSSKPQKPMTAKDTPLVAVLMGSDSDLPKLSGGLDILAQFKVPYTTRVTSAHRTPKAMAQFAETAADRGIEVILAAAGGAAHLPGMVAAYTSLPVIGIPIKPSLGDGMDSVLSILNMPKGVPVATVSLNNGHNAALLAVRILGIKYPIMRERYEAFMVESEKGVLAKDSRMEEVGGREYLKGMGV